MPNSRFYRLPQERQDHILEVAIAEFARAGYDGASLNQILERVGLSKGAAYYYFDGKEDLFVTALERAMGKVMEAIGDVSAALSGDDFWDDTAQLVRKMTQLFVDDPRLAGMVKAVPSAGAVSKTLAHLYAEAREFTEVFVRTGQARGAIRDDLPFELLIGAVLGVFQAVDQWALTHWTDVEENEVERLADIAVDLCRRVAEPRAGERKGT